MEIRIQCKGYSLSIQIGKKTDWFESIHLITIIKEYRSKKTKQVEYAELIWHSKF